MSEPQNYYRNCVYYFSIDGMCGRLVKSHKSVPPCTYRFNCPFFEADPSLTNKQKSNE